MNGELNGIKAVITGAATGIGRATAVVMAREGADVIVNYRESESEALKTVEIARSYGVKAYAIKADVTQFEDVRRLAEESKRLLGGVNALINNAGGLFARKSVEESDIKYWESLIRLNLTSAYIVTKEFIPIIKATEGEKSIINVASIAAIYGGGAGAFAYASAKGGLLTFTRAIAKDLGKYGIRAIAVLPGLIDTPYHVKAGTPDIKGWAERQVMLKRVGRPEEVGEVIAFLASRRASYINATGVVVDGGWLV